MMSSYKKIILFLEKLSLALKFMTAFIYQPAYTNRKWIKYKATSKKDKNSSK